MKINTSRIPSQKPEHLSHPKYRADIDGLRAIAVLSIVGFHAFPIWGKGGLIGVDIFFVISGFLISTIIFENLEHNRFSFIEFYSRRIRRIFPALLLVLIVCFGVGWLTLLADEYTQLGKHIAGGAGFISNFLFLNESGYFDNAADTKPLLHLWSLGIEEQFYIVWPLLLWGAWKKRFNLLTITLGIAVVSFVLNINTATKDAIAAFYSPQTRFWELLTGSILAYSTLYTQNFPGSDKNLRHGWKLFFMRNDPKMMAAPLRNVLSFSGAALLFIGLLVISRESVFPGWLALLPTVGTALIIFAGSQAWLNRTILAKRLLLWFGLISFPLYLWHWPLLSFARIIQSGHPAREVRVAAVLISIVLAWLTYKCIEKPMRFGRNGRIKTITLFIAMLIVGSVGYLGYQKEGLQFRAVVKNNPNKGTGWGGGVSKKNLINECGIANQKNKKLFAFCTQDSRQTPKFALLGDSKAAALYPGLFRTSTEEGRWLFIGGNGSNGAPAPILSENKIYKNYQRLTTIALGTIIGQENIETVALVTATRVLFRLRNDHSIYDLPASKHYNAALEGLSNAAGKLIRAGKKVVIVVDNPTLPAPKDCLKRKTSSKFLNKLLLDKPNEHCRIDIKQHLELSKQYRDLLLEVAARDADNIEIFDTTKYLCDIEGGVCQSHKNGHVLYNHTDHISDYAAGLIGKNLNEFLLEDSR